MRGKVRRTVYVRCTVYVRRTSVSEAACVALFYIH